MAVCQAEDTFAKSKKHHKIAICGVPRRSHGHFSPSDNRHNRQNYPPDSRDAAKNAASSSSHAAAS
jgi:hypothetical protein